MDNNKIWVLIACGKLSVGGARSMIMNYYRNIDKNKVQFAFAFSRQEKYDIDDEIVSLGGKVFYLPDFSAHPLKYYFGFKRLLKDNKYIDIVHAHNNFKNFLALSAAKKCSIKIRISHSHNTGDVSSTSFLQKIKNHIQRRLILNSATLLVGCSKKAYLYLYGNPKNEIIISNAIDIKKYKFNFDDRERIRNSLGCDNKVLIGTIGNFSKQKNVGFIIKMMSLLPMNYALVLGGESETTNFYKKMVSDLGLEERVFFLGKVDSSHFYSALDIFVLPSLFEGLPVVGIEALANGLPCILSNKITNEFEQCGLCHYLPIDCGEKIWSNFILENTDSLKRCDNEQRLIDNGFSIEKAAVSLEELYINLLLEQNNRR